MESFSELTQVRTCDTPAETHGMDACSEVPELSPTHGLTMVRRVGSDNLVVMQVARRLVESGVTVAHSGEQSVCRNMVL